MKRVFKSAAAIALALCMVLGCVSCGGKKPFVYEYSKESENMIRFSSSDASFDAFINDFFRRHLSYDEDRIYPIDIGESAWFAKEWESMALKFFDVGAGNLGTDRFEMVMNLVDNRVIDKYGYVWNGWHELEANPEVSQSGTQFMQGWPFPHQGHNFEDPCYEWEFNDDWMEPAEGSGKTVNDLNWHAYSKNSQGEVTDITLPYTDGFLTADVGLKYDEDNQRIDDHSEIVFESYDFSYNSFYMPFIEIDLRITSATSYGADSTLDDFYIEFQTEDGGEEWFREYQKEINTRPFQKIPSMFAQRIYFPMYLNGNWFKKGADGTYSNESATRITKLRFGFEAKEGETFAGDIRFNYIRPEFDTRRADNQAIYIDTIRNMFEFHGDKAMLEKYLPKVRETIIFYLKHLKGESGLLTVGELVGHEGIKETGNGIGNGYWDIQITPAVNLYSNVYFYRALESVVYLEKIAAEMGIEAEKPSVLLWDNSKYTYDYQISDLERILADCKKKMERNVEDGGFWNPATGRFVPGINPKPADDSNAEKYYDFGWATYNLEAITAGIGTPEQIVSVMDWISGKREIPGDTLTGEDMYKWEFAPLVNSVDNPNYLFWAYSVVEYGEQLQNGGAVLYLEYYDLMSRLKAYGADNVFERFQKVQAWYEKVKAAGGEGEAFYVPYYEEQGIVLEGWNGNGQIGIDTVFMESTILAAAMPDAFFGMKGEGAMTLGFTPNLPEKLDFMKMENAVFRGAKFDVSIGHDFFRLDSVRGADSSLKVLARVPVPKGDFTVTLNGTALSEGQYRVENGYVVVETSLANTVVTVK